MSLRPQLNVICGRCGKPHGLFDVCVTSRSRKQAPKLRLSFGLCPGCKREVSNPLTHVCAPRSDFSKRKKAHDREQRARDRRKRQQQAHDYTACADNECRRPLCTAYKTGWKDGDEAGCQRGWEQGYQTGFADGINACPRPHK